MLFRSTNDDFTLGWIFFSNKSEYENNDNIIESLRPIAISLALNLKANNNIVDLIKLKGLFELIPEKNIPPNVRESLKELFGEKR